MKVGQSVQDDLRRGKIIRSIIDDPQYLPPGHVAPDPASIAGKNAGPTGAVFMIDANQVRCNIYSGLGGTPILFHLPGLGCATSYRIRQAARGNEAMVH